MEDKAQLRIVLERLMEENRYNLEEYGKWKALAEKAGERDAAEKIDKAAQLMSAANEALKGARDQIG